MSSKSYIDKICAVVIVFAIIVTIAFINGEKLGLEVKEQKQSEYETRLFNDDKVHTINILMDNWNEFIEECEKEEYYACDLEIDGEKINGVGIRAKGNTSLSQVKNYDNDRYSFKIEFDKYDSTNLYYGLDKLSLNNIIQDNTYLKDYLTYKMMSKVGAISPLCSFTEILINDESFGLYLAVEGIEDAFLERNYGKDYGELYKPDSMDFGGGVGNGKKFDMENFDFSEKQNNEIENQENKNIRDTERPMIFENEDFSPDKAGGMGVKGSSDVSLIYTDDEFESYSNIFENAKTDVTDQDKKRLISSIKQMNNKENIDSVVDVESVIRYFAVHNFVCNFDSYTGSMIHNYYLYEKDGVLSMLPWDYNLAFGGFFGGNDASSLVNYPIDTPISTGTLENRPMLSWIFDSAEYTELYHNTLNDFITDYFDSGEFVLEIEKTYQMILPYVENDTSKFCTYEEFEKAVETLKEFCLLRAESIKGQIKGDIPSTSDLQAENKESFIDAGEIKISDMGSMGNMGDKREDIPQFNNSEYAQNQNSPSEMPNGEAPEMPNGDMNGMSPPDFSGKMPEIPDFENGNKPAFNDDFNGKPPNFES